jgi:HEXXH motif-containing protein
MWHGVCRRTHDSCPDGYVIANYEFTAETLRDFARLAASAKTLDMLRSTQMSKHLLLIKLVGEKSARGRWSGALAVFEQAGTSPVAARVIADPWTGAWVARCARQLHHTGELALEDALHFNALAAALAIGAGLDADLTLPVRNESLYLPTLGTVRIGEDGVTHRLVIRGGKAKSVPEDTEADTPTWLSHSWLSDRHDGVVTRTLLDDLSPFRSIYRLALPRHRLTPEEIARWRRLWTQAWSTLRECCPDRAAELSPYLLTAVPLSRRAGRAGFSATSRDAFGALALSEPDNGVNLAVTLIHESQHAKLGSLLDLVDLYHVSTNTYFAPWRKDPRPIGGLVQGTYAFLGVAEMWRRLSSDPKLTRPALRQFAHVREQVSAAATALEGAPELTAAGRVFAAGIRSRLDDLLDVDLPPDLVREARASVRRLRAEWTRVNAGGPAHRQRT